MASEKNPLEAYLSEKKAASWGQFAEGVSHGLGGVGGLGGAVGAGLRGAVGTAAVAGLGFGASRLHDAATKSRDFKNMLAYNPDLVASNQENPKLFNQMFSTLRTLNPQFSKDPLVAGEYMRSMSSDPMHAGGKAVESLNFRDKMGPRFGQGVQQGAQSGMERGWEHANKRELEELKKFDPLAVRKKNIEAFELGQKERAAQHTAKQLGLPFP